MRRLLAALILSSPLRAGAWLTWSSEEQPFSKQCTGSPGGQTGAAVTVVTGYWDIVHKYGSYPKTYFKWFENSLGIQAPMVFFYGDRRLLWKLKRFRIGLPTCWVYIPFRTLEETFAVMSGSLGPDFEKEQFKTFPADLRTVWLSKMLLLQKAREMDEYSTEWFAWMDAGVNAFRKNPHPDEPWPSANRVAALDPAPFYFSPVGANWANCFAATAFLIHGTRVSYFASFFYDTYRAFCAMQPTLAGFCEDDQSVFATMLKHRPKDFFSVAQWHNHSTSRVTPACPVHCGWGCVVSLLYSERYVCKDPELC